MLNNSLFGTLGSWLGVDSGCKFVALRCAYEKSLIAMSYLIAGLSIFSFCDDFSWLMWSRILACF